MLALQRAGKSTRDIAAATGRHIRTVQIELRRRERLRVPRRVPVQGGWFGRCPAFKPIDERDERRGRMARVGD